MGEFEEMKTLAILATLAAHSIFSDPGIMIDVDIIIHGPSGKGEVEIASCN